jgi:hypothetical protein
MKTTNTLEPPVVQLYPQSDLTVPPGSKTVVGVLVEKPAYLNDSEIESEIENGPTGGLYDTQRNGTIRFA